MKAWALLVSAALAVSCATRHAIRADVRHGRWSITLPEPPATCVGTYYLGIQGETLARYPSEPALCAAGIRRGAEPTPRGLAWDLRVDAGAAKDVICDFDGNDVALHFVRTVKVVPLDLTVFWMEPIAHRLVPWAEPPRVGIDDVLSSKCMRIGLL